MVRDLRVTTRAVESRPGGERVMLLGELAVDQGAYAEIGVPAPARVTRLLVNAGDTVRSGQALAEVTSPELGRARAEYLSAMARLRLADAALDRKRGLAAEKIAPLREVQEAESAAGEARAAVRAARAAIGAFGVEPPAADADAETASTFALRSPVGRNGDGANARSSDRCSIRRRPLSASAIWRRCGSPSTPSSGTRCASARE